MNDARPTAPDRHGRLRACGTGALVFAVGAVVYGAAEAVTNAAVGLYLPAPLWALVFGVYGAIGLVSGAAVGAGVGIVRRREPPGAVLMAVFLGALVFAHAALPVNDRYLPFVLHPLSLLANAAIGAAAAGVAAFAYRRIAGRRAGTAAAVFVGMSFILGAALAGAGYLDVFVTGGGGAPATVGAYAGLVAGAVGLWTLAARVGAHVERSRGARRAALGGVTALAAAGLALCARTGAMHAAVPGPAAATPTRPNVLWIVMDTVRADHLSLYGYARRTSPNLEALAADAVVFDEAFAQASWTIPSHYQMVTSRFAAGKSKILADGFVTAAELLRDQGYRTGAVLANFSLGRRSGFEQGFDSYVDGPVMIFYLTAFEKLPVVKALLRLPFVPGDVVLRYLHRKTFLEGAAVRADAVNAHAIRFVDRARPGPFFLFLNYMDAHDAYDPPRAYRSRFVPVEDPEVGFVRYNRNLGGTISSNQFVRDVLPRMTPERWRPVVGLYDAEIAYLDEQIGHLVEALKVRGLYDRTVIVVTADHGELLGEHGLANHFKALSEEEIHVPLLIRYPAALRPARVRSPVELSDVLPTLCELLGVTPPEAMDGRSLRPLLTDGAEGAAEDVFSFLIRPPDPKFPHTASGNLVAVRSGERKYVWSSTGMHAYYDLASDPTADRNTYGDTPEVAALAGRLEAWRKTVGLERLDGREQMDRLMRDRLRALGYIQ